MGKPRARPSRGEGEMTTAEALIVWADRFDELANECATKGLADGRNHIGTISGVQAARLATLLRFAAQGQQP